jgi:hypothetical protein
MLAMQDNAINEDARQAREQKSERLFQSGVRISGLWPIHGLTDAIPDSFKTAVEFLPLPEPIAALAPSYDPDEPGDAEWSEIAGDAYWKGLNGFLCVADCQIYRATSATSATSSWGSWRSHLFYGETADIAIELACEWAEQQFHDALAKWGAA